MEMASNKSTRAMRGEGYGLPALRPYQREAAQAVMRSVREGAGRTITIEIARQGGKNEVSAQIEVLLLALASGRDLEAVKTAPTLNPQLYASMRRLKSRLTHAGLGAIVRREGNAVRVGEARVHFLSAGPHANVVGHTANLLLEVDEAQSVDAEKYAREFAPMGATANVTTVMYGTAWDGSTLLERTKQANLEAERRDGIRRHFEYDWREIARYSAPYALHVEKRRQELGETHPTFLTQYCLQTIAGAERLFSHTQRALLDGDHARQAQRIAGEAYIAGLDIGGGAPDGDVVSLHDATVLTIGRVVFPEAAALVQAPRVEIVEHYAWAGEPHEALLPQIVDLLRRWRCGRVAVDATGLGETASRIIAQTLGESKVEGVKFTATSKSELGFDLIAAVNGARLKMYAADGSTDCHAFWQQAELARAGYRANGTMTFFCDPAECHDDYLVSAALLVRASKTQTRRTATGRVRVEGALG
jgi:hypothetical protein